MHTLFSYIKHFFLLLRDFIDRLEEKTLNGNPPTFKAFINKNKWLTSFFYPSSKGKVFAKADFIIFIFIFLSIGISMHQMLTASTSKAIEELQQILFWVFVTEFTIRSLLKGRHYMTSWGAIDGFVIVVDVFLFFFPYSINPTFIRFLRLFKLFRFIKFLSYWSYCKQNYNFIIETIKSLLKHIFIAIIIFSIPFMMNVFSQEQSTTDSLPDLLIRTWSDLFNISTSESTATDAQTDLIMVKFGRMFNFLYGVVFLSFLVSLFAPKLLRLSKKFKKEYSDLYLSNCIIIAVVRSEMNRMSPTNISYLEEMFMVFSTSMNEKVILIAEVEPNLDFSGKNVQFYKGNIDNIDSIDKINILSSKAVIIVGDGTLDYKNFCANIVHSATKKSIKIRDQSPINLHIISSKNNLYLRRPINDNPHIKANLTLIPEKKLLSVIEENIIDSNSIQFELYRMLINEFDKDLKLKSVRYNINAELILDETDTYINLSVRQRGNIIIILQENEDDSVNEFYNAVDKAVRVVDALTDKSVKYYIYCLVTDFSLMKAHTIYKDTYENLEFIFTAQEMVFSLAIYHEIIMNGSMSIWLSHNSTVIRKDLSNCDQFRVRKFFQWLPSYSKVRFFTSKELKERYCTNGEILLGLIDEDNQFIGFHELNQRIKINNKFELLIQNI
jgi:hypothetical protein